MAVMKNPVPADISSKIPGVCGEELNDERINLPAGDCAEKVCQDSASNLIQDACGGFDATLLYTYIPFTASDSLTRTSTPNTKSTTRMQKSRITRTSTTSSEAASSESATSSELTKLSTILHVPASASQTTNQQVPHTSSSATISSTTHGPGRTAEIAGVVIGVVFAAALVITGMYLLVKPYRTKGTDTSSIETWGNSASEEPWGICEHIQRRKGGPEHDLRTSLGSIIERQEKAP